MSNLKFHYFSKANILNNQFSSVFTTDDDCSIMFDGHPYPNIPTIQIDTLGVTSLLCNLGPHKAPGPNGISPRFLKKTFDSIAPALALIYKQGKLPSDWKGAFVVPIFKKGFIKLLEHIIFSTISTQANHHNIICKQQHGFRKNLSCETQLLVLLYL